MSWGGAIERLGLTNRSSEDLGTLALSDTAGVVRTAYCSSLTCNPRKDGRVARTKKKVSLAAYECPDCENVLYWESKRVNVTRE